MILRKLQSLPCLNFAICEIVCYSKGIAVRMRNGVGRAARLIFELIFVYLSDGNFKGQCNVCFLFNRAVIIKTVIQNYHLYSVFLICSLPLRCWQVLQKMDFTCVSRVGRLQEEWGLSGAAYCRVLTCSAQIVCYRNRALPG